MLLPFYLLCRRQTTGGLIGLLLFSFLPVLAQSPEVLVASLTLQVPDAAALQAWQKQHPQTPMPFATHYYGFQQGDVLVLSLDNEKGRSSFSLDIVDHASGSLIYSAQQVKKLRNLRLPVTHRAVYQFTLRVDAATASAGACQFTIRRLPAHDSARHFNSHVTWQTRRDTTWTTTTEKVLVKTDLVPQTLLDKQFRVEPKANLMASNKATVKFQLPKNTSHWVYWVGVGQEPVLQLNDITKQFSKIAASALMGTSPVIAFGLGLLPYLPQVTSGGNIDYYFLNRANAAAFMQEGKLKPFAFASGQKVVSDYLNVPLAQTPKTDDGHLYMGFQNNNTLTGLDITLKVVAFTAAPKFETRQVRKPAKITESQVPVFGQ